MVVLADDDPQVRSITKAMLSHAGFVVREAENGGNALSLVNELKGHISLLVSDVQMPGLNGLDLASKVKEQFPRIPVLLISGFGENPEWGAADGFLDKPFTADLLISKVWDVMHGAY